MGVSVSGSLVTSNLLITGGVPSDAGPYSCTSTVYNNKDFPRAVVMVHLIQGKDKRQQILFVFSFILQGTSWLFKELPCHLIFPAGMACTLCSFFSQL